MKPSEEYIDELWSCTDLPGGYKDLWGLELVAVLFRVSSLNTLVFFGVTPGFDSVCASSTLQPRHSVMFLTAHVSLVCVCHEKAGVQFAGSHAFCLPQETRANAPVKGRI